jgi:hypothetical protein
VTSLLLAFLAGTHSTSGGILENFAAESAAVTGETVPLDIPEGTPPEAPSVPLSQ